MSPSGFVITRLVNPVPAAVNTIAVVPPPTTISFAVLVVSDALDADVDDPAAELAWSSGDAVSAPEYSRMRTSGNGTDPLNDTDTRFELAPAALIPGA